MRSQAARALSTNRQLPAPRDSASSPSAPLPANKIETARTGDFRCQPIEQRFAHAIRARTQARQRWKLQFPSAPLAADDTQLAVAGR